MTNLSSSQTTDLLDNLRMKLLVIEDETKLAEYLQKGLGEEGFVVDAAHNGIDGLHLATEQPCDLIILDGMLPGIDGLAVLAASGQLETPPKDTAFLGELALDGSLRVYSKDNGKLLTDTTVEPVEHQQRVRMSNYGSGYVWLKLQDNDRYETTATRLYGPQGLVSDLTALQGKYSYVDYLTTDPDGSPMFCGSRAAAGSAYGNVYDVLDADGKVVLQGLSSCTGYYSNSLNALPDHVFAAQRGFYVGWMDTSGNWLYCQSIFSSATADDVPSYGY